MSLEGKTVIVTGAARDEGCTAAEGLLRAGARVSLWDADGEGLAEAAQELQVQDLTPHCRVVDVRNWRQVMAAFDNVVKELGPVDVLVNNDILKMSYMGRRSGPLGPFWELDLIRLRREVAVNTLGTYHCCRMAAIHMTERHEGSIVNLGTSEHTMRSPSHIPYGPSAAWIEQFSLAASEQLRPFGVRMNLIKSGGQMNRRHQSNPEAVPYDAMVPTICYLAGEDSARVTGKIFVAGRLESSGKPI